MFGTISAYIVGFIILVGGLVGIAYMVLYSIEVNYEPDEFEEYTLEDELRDLRTGDWIVDSCFEKRVRELGIENPVFFTPQELGC